MSRKWLTATVLLLAALGSLAYGLLRHYGSAVATDSGRNLPPPDSQEAEPLELFRQIAIGNDFEAAPRISYLEIIDLNADGLPDILVCDCTSDTVSWLRQNANGQFEELEITGSFTAPARVECVDFDQDGDLDIFLAVLGKLFPSDDKVGSLVFLENDGEENFEARVLLEGVARISDVRVADLDLDQDLDLVVTHFGYYEGLIQWLENKGDWSWEPHVLQNQAGGIHGVVGDLNQDQRPDIALLVSQEVESIYVFYGEGQGKFREEKIYSANNPDFGSAGIWLVDLDQDDDLDVLYCNGDAFDYSPPRPWPWHGVQWLENRHENEDGNFTYHRLLDFGGAVNATAADYDDDGDLDIFVSSAFNDWQTPASQSLRLLNNTGSMKFLSHPLGNSPSHIQALDIGDVNGDGLLDLVTGGMHISEPYDRIGRVVLWLRMPPASTSPN